MDKHYVFDGRCVYKTGRYAIPQVKKQRRMSLTETDDNILYEIKLQDGDSSWSRWVKDSDLYKILEDPSIDHNIINNDDSDVLTSLLQP